MDPFQNESANTNMYVVVDLDSPCEEGRAICRVTVWRNRDRVLMPQHRILWVKVAVGNDHVVGNRYMIPDENPFRAFEYRADKRRPDANADKAIRLNTEYCSAKDFRSRSKDECCLPRAPNSLKAFVIFEVASVPDNDVVGQLRIVPLPSEIGCVVCVHGESPNRIQNQNRQMNWLDAIQQVTENSFGRKELRSNLHGRFARTRVVALDLFHGKQDVFHRSKSIEP